MTYDAEAAKEWPHDKSHVGSSPFGKPTDAEHAAVLRRHFAHVPDSSEGLWPLRAAIERAIELLERERVGSLTNELRSVQDRLDAALDLLADWRAK